MDQIGISEIIRRQRIFFSTGITRDTSFRVQQLKTLKNAVAENEAAILKSLKLDLNKPDFESYFSEISMVLGEINYAIKRLGLWVKPKKVKTPPDHFLASSYIYPEPYGVVLIIGTWNYPLQLIISPLVGSIAAGNCSLLKPSEISSSTSQLIAEIIGKNFEPDFISVVEGGVETMQSLLAQQFDYIFFTGGTGTGKIVMESAAKHLTPATLEMGGKSPCIVDRDIHVDPAAKRIVWGKFFNAGQTCVAPDYLLVDKRVKKKLLERMEHYLKEFYGDDPTTSPDYGRIISDKHFARLSRLLREGETITGGEIDPHKRYIAPTIINNVSLKDRIMEEEVLGPILPVIDYEDLTEAISIVNKLPKPLALYFFSRNRNNQERILKETSSGGVCINDTLIHLDNRSLPFGGVGPSGMGRYNGKASFCTFSNEKSVLKKSSLYDIRFLRYPPYRGKMKLVKFLKNLIS